MKNHVLENGRILQTNKKWSHLKQKQKNLIVGWLQEEYRCFIEVYLRKPKRYEEEYMLDSVMERIQAQGIWIPYIEVKTYFTSKKGKWYRKLENEFENKRKEEKLVHIAYENIGTPFI
ncbi:transposase [Bacillus toyonensis]|uniref:transposase n=1 Tax=Bacillus toyonensis TaxID=155322 RepID=UPI001C0B0862|nr:transposase [Bacillus toyonensis]MBU4642330.1 transposase [Bacillus toyonensis]